MRTRLSIRDGAVLIASVAAGALAVPLSPIATPASALVAALVCLLGLRVWRWSRLPGSMKTEAPRGVTLLLTAAWAALGLLVGLVVLAIIRIGIEPAVPAIGARMAAAAALPVWRRALIIYVAAVGEELLFRVLLLSLVAGLVDRLLRAPDREPSRGVVWAANAVSALAFSAAHLPSWAGIAPSSPGLTLAILSLNAAAGIVLGYVFVTRGIGAAMWAHAGADCALQLIGPLTG